MFIPTHLPAASGGGVGVGTTNADTKNPLTFNGGVLVLNSPSDSPDSTYEVVSVGVDDQYSLGSEPLPQSDGMQITIPRKPRKLIHIDGIVKATTLAALEYKVMQLHRYLDPINAFWDDSSSTMDQDKGFLPLTFDIPTSDTTNYATGVISVKAYVRSVQRAVRLWSKISGYNARFAIVFEMIDPRFYEASTQTVSLNNGSNTSHTSITEYPTFGTLNLVLSSSPALITITRKVPDDENGSDMVVHLDPTSTLGGAAAVSTDTITLDMKTGVCKLNGTQRDDFLVAGKMGFWPIMPGSNTLYLDMTGTFSTKTMTYNRAYV